MAAALSGVTPILIPLGIAYCISRTVTEAQTDGNVWLWISLLFLVMVVGSLGSAVGALVSRYLRNFGETTVLGELRDAMVAPRYVDRFHDSEFQSNFAFAFNTAGASRAVRVQNVLQAATGILFFATFLVLLWSSIPGLAIVLLLAVPFFGLAERGVGKLIAEGSMASSPAMRAMSYLGTTIGTTSVIAESQLLGANDFLFGQLANRLGEAHGIMTRTAQKHFLAQTALGALAAVIAGGAAAVTVATTSADGSIVFALALVPQLPGAITALTAPIRIDRSSMAGDHALQQALQALDHGHQTKTQLRNDVTSQASLDLSNVSLYYGSHPALEAVSLELHPGTITGVCGMNGSGKSSLLAVASALQSPTKGSVFIHGRRVTERSLSEVRTKIAGLVQNPVRYEATLADNINLGRDAVRPIAQRFTGRIQDLELTTDLTIGFTVAGRPLSGGQWKRVALDRLANLGNFQIYILDEPEAELDPMGRLELTAYLSELRAANKVVLFATHSAEMLAICDKVVELQTGRVRRSGSFSEMARVEESFVALSLNGNGQV